MSCLATRYELIRIFKKQNINVSNLNPNRLFIKKDYVRNIFTTFSVDVRQNCKPGILLPIYFLGIKTHAKRDTTNAKKIERL